MREQTSGLDHLGLGSVSNQRILVNLSPDLFVQTVHPGYHSFYSFVLDEFWRRDDLPRTRASWREFYRSKELIFSIACNTCDHPEYGGQFGAIVGSGKTAALAAQPPPGGYSTDVDYIKNPLGGYGLYYRSIMASMGLVYLHQDTDYPVDLPTELGKQLADAFRQRISATRYWKRYFQAERVPEAAVTELGETACLCRLRGDVPDLDLVREVVLRGGPPASAAGRRSSLRMLLDLAAATASFPVDQASYRQLIYYGEAESGAVWRATSELPSPPNQLGIVDTWRRWRLYQAREFYAYALEGLWRWLVDWGLGRGGDARPIPVREAVEALVASLDPDGLAESLDGVTPSMRAEDKLSTCIRSLRELAGEPVIPPAEDAGWADRSFALDADLSEWALYVVTGRGSAEPEILATACLALMLLTATRFDYRPLEYRDDWSYARVGGIQRLSFDGFVSSLRRRVEEQASVGDAAGWLLQDYVIAQHLRVAGSKLPFNTYRFVQEGDALRFFDRTRPIGMNSARFDALSHTVSDLGFVGPLALQDHLLTPQGERFLGSGDWERGS
ncbi:MAG: hypothetical protein ACJ77A_01320 [Actinomycetota bacterium]